MLWKTPPPLHIPPMAQPVPDAHALRLAALQASWQRDRWVARRRLALRWLLWYLKRYGAQAAAGVAAVAAVWLWVLPLAMPDTRIDAVAKAAAADKAAAAADKEFVVPPLNFDTALHSQEP